jgi:hypothetical protein
MNAKPKVNIMIRPRIASAAILLTLAAWPATAADWPVRRPMVYQAPPAVYVYAPSPFYVVNQGPEHSGPGIMIVDLGYTHTDLKRTYPFIGRTDGIPVRFRSSDFYGITPDHIETGSVRTSRHARQRRR